MKGLYIQTNSSKTILILIKPINYEKQVFADFKAN